MAKPFLPSQELEFRAVMHSLAPLSIPPASPRPVFLPWDAGWEQVKVRSYRIHVEDRKAAEPDLHILQGNEHI